MEAVFAYMDHLEQVKRNQKTPVYWAKTFGKTSKPSTPKVVRFAEKAMTEEERKENLKEAGYLSPKNLWEDPHSDPTLRLEPKGTSNMSTGTEGPTSPQGFIPQTGLFLYSPRDSPHPNTPEDSSRASSPDIITLDMLSDTGHLEGQVLLNRQVQI
jgi:hypothetical protein